MLLRFRLTRGCSGSMILQTQPESSHCSRILFRCKLWFNLFQILFFLIVVNLCWNRLTISFIVRGAHDCTGICAVPPCHRMFAACEAVYPLHPPIRFAQSSIHECQYFDTCQSYIVLDNDRQMHIGCCCKSY